MQEIKKKRQMMPMRRAMSKYVHIEVAVEITPLSYLLLFALLVRSSKQCISRPVKL